MYAYTMMIGNAILWLVWILNTAMGNYGGNLHMVFWRATQVTPLLSLLELIFEVLAIMSYGTKVQVWNSWTG